MKSLLSLALIACLVAPAVPVAAQEQAAAPFDIRGSALQATAGPLARAATREADRLVAAGELTPSDGAAAWQSGKSAPPSDWSRVRKLAPGTEIIVTVKGAPPARRYFVAEDESDVTVLKMADPTLPAAVRDLLREVASDHPEYLSDAQHRRASFVLERKVRVGPDGVFVADQKVADLTQVVENISRFDVAEVRGPLSYSPRHDALVGLGFGAAAFGGIALLLCTNFGGCGPHDIPSVLGVAARGGGILAGISVATGAAAHAVKKPTGILYRAP